MRTGREEGPVSGITSDHDTVASDQDLPEVKRSVSADAEAHLNYPEKQPEGTADIEDENLKNLELSRRITFDPSIDQHQRRDTALYIPGPRDRDRGDYTQRDLLS